jgi:CRP/FNR family transcriptional regulator
MNIEQERILELVVEHFPSLAEPALQKEIAEVGSLLHFNAGQIVMDYGSYVRMVPLIIEGSIKVTREEDEEGKEMILYFLGKGETCAMTFTCCMMEKKSAFRTEAMEDTSFIGIPVKFMDQWMTKYQSWKNFIMRTYDTKMMELIEVLDSVSFEAMDQRLLKYLRARSEAIGSKTIECTHQEIANDLNASREAVSRLLKKMENKGLVSLHRNRVDLK